MPRFDQFTDRQMILYAAEDRADRLAILLKLEGYGTVTREQIMDRADKLIDLWQVGEDTSDCYVCGHPQLPLALCPCYNGARISVYNCPEVLAIIPDDEVLGSYICGSDGCRKGGKALVKLHAWQVKKQVFPKGIKGPATGVFKFPHFCQPCWKRMKQGLPSNRPHSRASIGDSVAPSKLETLKQVVASTAPDTPST